VAPSLTRGWVCNLLVQLLLGLARAVTLGSKFRGPHDHILLSHLRLPQLGGPGPSIYIPQEQGGLAIPLGTPFPFVASYDSQGYGGGILTRLHTGYILSQFIYCDCIGFFACIIYRTYANITEACVFSNL
jgi:hypothetical protein